MFPDRSCLEGIHTVLCHTVQSKTTLGSSLIPTCPQIPVLLATSPALIDSKSLSLPISLSLSLISKLFPLHLPLIFSFSPSYHLVVPLLPLPSPSQSISLPTPTVLPPVGRKELELLEYNLFFNGTLYFI